MLNENALRALEIDMAEGLACCADDPEFYEEMLGEYAAEGPARAEELQRFYEAADWADYAIRAHSVKSTSRMIGADAFAERARILETAAKAGDAAAVRAAHDAFLRDYRALQRGIREALE